MKNILVVIFFVLVTTSAFSQENSLTLSGGYAFSKVEDSDVSGSGYKLNVLYEYNPGSTHWAHGISVGYINTSFKTTELLNTITYDVNNWPVYYSPKYLFGTEKFKGFIKGAIGWQIAHFEKSGVRLSATASDTGFVGGGGAGMNFNFTEKVFISAEYELLYMSNSYYKDGIMNTASLGIGFRF